MDGGPAVAVDPAFPGISVCCYRGDGLLSNQSFDFFVRRCQRVVLLLLVATGTARDGLQTSCCFGMSPTVSSVHVLAVDGATARMWGKRGRGSCLAAALW